MADEDANPLGRLQDQRMRQALVDAIQNLPEREQYVMSSLSGAPHAPRKARDRTRPR